jgi:O-antigen/teichoic acid export membrane protein
LLNQKHVSEPQQQQVLDRARIWGRTDATVASIARNVGTRYLVIGVDTLVGLFLMPINLNYLGQAAWGLWLLCSSLNAYFTVLDLGYGGSITRFVAQYRAKEDARAINEIASTLFVLFSFMGVAIYGAFVIAAFHVDWMFKLTPDQVETARTLMLILGTQVALGVPFGVFGGVMNGFQRYDINNVVAVGTLIIVAIVNVVVLTSGYGLIAAVTATTAVRLASKFVYARNAYFVFPLLSVRPSLFRRERLREVTGYSVYSAIAGWAFRLNYMSDTIIIGAFIGPVGVALWAVPRRLGQAVRSFTNQLNNVLLPVVVESDTRRKSQRLRMILLHGTKLSLLGVLPLATAMFLLSDPLIPLYVGEEFRASVPVAQVLAAVIAFRVANATSQVVLKGGSAYRMYAFTQLGIAIVNVALSVWWIQWYGLVGQAMGTLVPLALASMFIMWPAACRSCGIGTTKAFRQAVWPTLWPLPAMIAPVLLLKPLLPASIPSVLLCGSVGLLCYLTVALWLAMDRAERALYLAKIHQVVPVWPGVSRWRAVSRRSARQAHVATAAPVTPSATETGGSL